MGTIEEREKDPLQFLGRVWQFTEGRLSVGFKLCWKQSQPIFDAVLEQSGIRKIVLKRKNRIKSFVSLLLARQTGEWVIYDDSSAPVERPKVRVDCADLLSHIAINAAYYEEIAKALQKPGQRSQTVFYEDLFDEHCLASTASFLGATQPDATLMSGQTWKLSSRPLRDSIVNFNDLATDLKGTGLEEELYSAGI